MGGEKLKVGTLSIGTVENYLGAIRCIKKHPIADRRLKTVTTKHLQTFLDLLTFGGTCLDGTVKKGMSKEKRKTEEVDLFSEEDTGHTGTQPISHESYEKLIAYLEKKNLPTVLPIQIAYYAGLRIGEVCGLTWQNINLEEQYLTVKRSVRYDGAKHKTIIGSKKRKKVRTVDFGDTLTGILKRARKEQLLL